MKRIKVKDLKEAIKNLPDDMPVLTKQEDGVGGYNITTNAECKSLYRSGEDFKEKDMVFLKKGEYKPTQTFVIGVF